MAASINEYKKAVLRLENALSQELNEYIRDSVIQRFEFCIELALKVSKKKMGTATTAPKQVIREMAQNALIDNVDLWLQAIDERNLTSYTYNEDLAIQVYNFVKDFSPNFKLLLSRLEKL